jgi:hypothetical protein
MMEVDGIRQVSCGGPHGMKHVYTCQFKTNKYDSTTGVAQVVVPKSGGTFSVEDCQDHSDNKYQPKPYSDPCAVLE